MSDSWHLPIGTFLWFATTRCTNPVQPFLPCRFLNTSQSRHLQCLKDTSIRNPFKLDKLTCNTFSLAEELLLYYYRKGIHVYATQLYAIIILQMCMQFFPFSAFCDLHLIRCVRSSASPPSHSVLFLFFLDPQPSPSPHLHLQLYCTPSLCQCALLLSSHFRTSYFKFSSNKLL